jgi:UDP-arabinose 4-epimerase
VTRLLVTGGAGYIGSHTCKMLAEAGHECLTVDNLSRGHRDLVKWGLLVEAELRDTDKLRQILAWYRPEAVIHFAALAYVGESVKAPHAYYENNVLGTLSLLEAMRSASVDKLIVSSSCATYGQPERMPVTEESPLCPVSPYGRSKLMMEEICSDYQAAYGLHCLALRYFNAAGADPQKHTGERHDPEPHLVPRLLMAASGEIERLDVFGDDHPTPDGTCIRDYVHVTDLASAHVAGATYLLDGGMPGAINLGTGEGASVLEIIEAASRTLGGPVPYRVSPRRAGDPPSLVAAAAKARQVLGWYPVHSDLDEIISSAWAWYAHDRLGGLHRVRHRQSVGEPG